MRYTIVIKKPAIVAGSTPEQIEAANVANFVQVKDFVEKLEPTAIFLQYPNYCVMGAELTDEQRDVVEKQPLVESVHEEVIMHTCCGGALHPDTPPEEPVAKTGCCGGKCS